MTRITKQDPKTCKHDSLSRLKRLTSSSEPEGIRRDAECRKCGTKFMVTKAGLVEFNRRSAHG